MIKNNFFKKILLIFLAFFVFLSNTSFAKELRIVQFSDIHIDTTRENGSARKYAYSLNMFQKAIIKVNAINPDIVVFSGDMVNSPREKDFDIFLKNAKQLNPKFYFALGNHDVGVGGGLSKESILTKINTNCDWLNVQKPYYSVIKDDYVLIFLDGTTDKKITSKGFFEKDVLAFLDKTLQSNLDKKAIIIQHFPLLEPYPSKSHEIENQEEYFNIIDKYDNVILILAGHYHATRASVRNNVLHVATPSLIEFPHAFRYLVINDNGGEISIHSEIVMDKEQNSRENVTTPYARLKLGFTKDNNFDIILKK